MCSKEFGQDEFSFVLKLSFEIGSKTKGTKKLEKERKKGKSRNKSKTSGTINIFCIKFFVRIVSFKSLYSIFYLINKIVYYEFHCIS